MRQFELVEKKEISKLDGILKKAGKVTAKIPSVTSIKKSADEIAELTKSGVKSGLKKSATKVAGIGVAGVATAAVGKLAATGIGGALVATGAGSAVVAAVPLVVGVTATCILDDVVKSVTENEK